MFNSEEGNNINKNTFVANSGASAHMIHTREMITDFKDSSSNVKIGDTSTVQSKGTGTFIGYHINKNVQEIEIKLQNVLFFLIYGSIVSQ